MKYTVVATTDNFPGKFFVGAYDEESPQAAKLSAQLEFRASDMTPDRVAVFDGLGKPLLGDILGMDRP